MLTTNKLINRALRRCFWPTDPATGLGLNAPLSDADILELADEDLQGDLYPQLISADVDYSLATLDYDITAGEAYYRVPSRVYGPIKDFLEVQANSDNTELDMGQFKLEDIGRPDRQGFSQRSKFSVVMDGDFFRLWPLPADTDGKVFRIRYYRQPSKLALLATCAGITARATVNVFGTLYDTLTLDTDLAALYGASAAVDTISAAGAHQLLDDTLTAGLQGSPSPLIATRLVTAGGFDSHLAVGDYIAPAGYTPIVQIPSLMEALFVQRVACSALRAKGDRPALDREQKVLEKLEKRAESVLTPRSRAEPDYIVTRNSVLRQGVSFRRIW